MFELDKTYDAQKVEDKWYARWLGTKAFHAEAGRAGRPIPL